MSTEVLAMTRTAGRSVTALALLSILALAASEAWARAGGGGSRGSRSYSAPASPPASPTVPSSPSRQYGQPAPGPMSPGPRPSPFGGLFGGLAGFALGGLLGGLLFGGLGHGSGIGLLDLLLIGGGIMLLVSFLRRRQAGPQPAYAGAGGGPSAYQAGPDASARAVEVEMPAATSDLDRGLGYIRSMDASFDPQMLAADARGVFTDLQAAIMRRDLSAVRDRLAPDMLASLQTQCDRLRDARQTNRVERITIRRADVSEAWQERGQDWATVYLAASLVDYTVDDSSGRVIDGSPDRPQDIEEYWTFTRPVGNHSWKLSAIQTA
jgi:predicted lipid-binding transport protein (Tim44 family)